MLPEDVQTHPIGRNLYLSGCGAGRLGGKPAYGTAVGIFTSGWGGGGLGGIMISPLRPLSLFLNLRSMC